MAHRRQSRPDSGLGVQVNILKNFEVVASSLSSHIMFLSIGFRKSIPPQNCQHVVYYC